MTEKKCFSGFSGSAAIRQEYGFIPYLYDASNPAYILSGIVEVGFRFYGIPLKMEFAQSNKKTINGLGNYFTLSFDAPAYKNISEEGLNKKKELLKSQLDSLKLSRAGIEKKLTYINILKLPNLDNLVPELPDTLNQTVTPGNINSYSTDSLQHLQWKKDSIQYSKVPHSSLDSLNRDELIHLYDSLRYRYNQLNTAINTANEKLQLLENASNVNDSILKKPMSGSWLQRIEKFEIGLSSPTYSDWLINCPVKGVNIQTQSLETFSAVTYGTVIDYNYLNTALKIDRWKNFESDFGNAFHFNKAENGRKVIAGQIGYGNRNTSFISLGFLRGIGHQNYYSTVVAEPVATELYDKNYVAELTGQIHFLSHTIRLTYAKSALMSNQEDANAFEKLSERNDSRVFALRHNTEFKKVKATLYTDAQWIDPLFKSYGLSYRKADRFNSKIKIVKDIKMVKLSLFYKYEEDNVLNTYSYKNTSNSFGLNASWRINRNVSVKGSFSPIVIKNVNEGVASYYRNFNYLAGINLKKRIGKVSVVNDLMYSMNYSFDSTSVFSYQIGGCNTSVFIDDKMFFINANYFKQESEEKKEDYSLLEAGTQMQVFKKLSITCSAKGMIKSNSIDPGYEAEVTYALSKSFEITAGIDQTIQGEFYSESQFRGTDTIKYQLEIKYLFHAKK
ncbi:MAG: hypothetical protein ABI772_10960 [Bacteroidota bacterium]